MADDDETRSQQAERILKEAEYQRLTCRAELEQDRTSNHMLLGIGEHELRIRVVEGMQFRYDRNYDRIIGSVVENAEGISQYKLLEKILLTAATEQRFEGKTEQLNPAQCELVW